jgi:hypothetical protein
MKGYAIRGNTGEFICAVCFCIALIAIGYFICLETRPRWSYDSFIPLGTNKQEKAIMIFNCKEGDQYHVMDSHGNKQGLFQQFNSYKGE